MAIIDTEPHKRALKKSMPGFAKILGDKGSLLAQQTISGTAKLKLYCNPAAIKEVEKVERKVAIVGMTKLMCKIAILCLGTLCIIRGIALLKINSLAQRSIKIQVFLLTVVTIKVLFLFLNLLSIKKMWGLSDQGYKGVAQICGLEGMGFV